VPKTIYDTALISLMPPNMQDDAETCACCAALDAMTALITDKINRVRVLADIGDQDSDVTDLLAIERHVDYYDQNLPLETRRNLVKNSGFLHRIKGTPAAVEQVARMVFGSATVQEWFEYGGEPYHFRVLINEFPGSDSQTDEVKRAINSAKNERSWLDEVNIIASMTTGTIYTGGAVQISSTINLTQR
jgi:phage tail P2-like protein